jgi:AraC-like DNA-binding protein
MTILTRIPAPPLAGFIQGLWLVDATAPAHAKERVLPTGEMQIILPLRPSPGFNGGIVVGARSECSIINASMGPVMGVHFRPGGGYPFFGLPAGELRNSVVALGDLWGTDAGDLSEQILAAREHPERLAVLERWLMKLFPRPADRHPAVPYALRTFLSAPHAGTVASVTHQIGLSPRRFIDVFRDQVGLTPKVFCRIRRFQRAVQAVHGMQKVEWARVAADGGYFDQAHFIHDFRAFSGINPSEYMAHRTPAVNHVVLPD